MRTLLLSLLCFTFLSASCNDDEGTPVPEEMEEEMMEEEMMEEEEQETEPLAESLRFMSYNVSFFRDSEGALGNDLESGAVEDIKKVAETIQFLRPDFIALMEFDYSATGDYLGKFQDNYLSVSQNGREAIEYPYAYAVPSNTGVLAEVDLDGNGSISLPNDAYGFGNFEGQYAFAMLSKYPLDLDNTRSFQEMLWKDMPDANLPENADGSSYYSEEALNVFRLSSKNHVDVPVILPDGTVIHALLSHPTPPIFDGAEDRNGLRNHDEIKLFADYISGASYLVDDAGNTGGLASGEHFVIMGDLNADPVDGDSAMNAIGQLLDHPKVNPGMQVGGAHVPGSIGGQVHGAAENDTGDSEHDTSFFGLRVDYVLPSAGLTIIDSEVFWPSPAETEIFLISASDHLPVWVDLCTSALCVENNPDTMDDELLIGEWQVVSITQTIVGSETLDMGALGTMMLNEDGTGSRNYSFTFTSPNGGSTLPLTVIEDFNWEIEEGSNGDILKITNSVSGGVENIELSVNNASSLVGTSVRNISSFITTLEYSFAK